MEDELELQVGKGVCCVSLGLSAWHGCCGSLWTLLLTTTQKMRRAEAEARVAELEDEEAHQQEINRTDMEAFKQQLAAGMPVLKYGRKGSPHQRTLELRPAVGHTLDGPAAELGASRLVWHGGKKGFRLDSVVAVVDGARTPQFLRSLPEACRKPESDIYKCCFSILTPVYSLNLQASSQKEKDMWVKGMHLLLPRLRWANFNKHGSPDPGAHGVL